MTFKKIASKFFRFFIPRRKLRFTGQGRTFFVLAVAIGLAAMNTGNNLLYLILAWMFSMIMASGALSEVTMRSLTIRRQLFGHVFANRPFLIEISLTNTKEKLASYSIEIEDLIGKQSLQKRCYFLKIPPQKTQRTSYQHTFTRRGLHLIDAFRVSTKFPFNFFKKSVVIAARSEVLVLPEIYSVHIPTPKSKVYGFSDSKRRGRSGDFYGLREYRYGDDPRDVHWRSTARSGRMIVREWEEEAERKITILCDNALTDPNDNAELEVLEKIISHAGSLVNAYLRRGYAIALNCRGEFLPHGRGPQHIIRALKLLAMLPACGSETPYGTSLDKREEILLVDSNTVASRLLIYGRSKEKAA